MKQGNNNVNFFIQFIALCGFSRLTETKKNTEWLMQDKIHLILRKPWRNPK